LWPFIDTSRMDRSTVPGDGAADHTLDADSPTGPVMIQVTFTVAPEHQRAFLEAMIMVRLSRLRTGAISWGLLRAIDSANVFTESFTVPTWEEHVRQQTERTTGTDQDFLDVVKGFSDPEPQVVHLSVIELPDPGSSRSP
jgi:hypothetical protein